MNPNAKLIPTIAIAFDRFSSDEISDIDLDNNNQESLVKRRVQKHSVKHKETQDKGYKSWQPK